MDMHDAFDSVRSFVLSIVYSVLTVAPMALIPAAVWAAVEGDVDVGTFLVVLAWWSGSTARAMLAAELPRTP